MFAFKSISVILSMILVSIYPDNLNITYGHISKLDATSFVIHDSVRGLYGTQPSDIVEIDFVYHGPSEITLPLANGEVRRQIGLKLRAHDTCNLIYIMWHVEPTQGIHVSVKNNPGKDQWQQCRAHGYINLVPYWETSVATIRVNEKHSLRASIVGNEIQVVADGVFVWKGVLPKQAFTFDGPIGLRSDNGIFDATFKVKGS
jgi:hypothetical protein